MIFATICKMILTASFLFENRLVGEPGAAGWLAGASIARGPVHGLPKKQPNHHFWYHLQHGFGGQLLLENRLVGELGAAGWRQYREVD